MAAAISCSASIELKGRKQIGHVESVNEVTGEFQSSPENKKDSLR